MSLVSRISDLATRIAQEFQSLRTEIKNNRGEIVVQAAHGFSVNQGIRLDGNVFFLAQADNADNAQIIGVVTEVINADTFRYQESGIIPGNWTKGVNYFLSVTTPGLIASEPTYSVGNVRQFVGTGVDDGLLLEIDVGDEISEFPESGVAPGGTTGQILVKNSNEDFDTKWTAESDPVFSASPAASILQENIDNWNSSFSWGDHAQAGYMSTWKLTVGINTLYISDQDTVELVGEGGIDVSIGIGGIAIDGSGLNYDNGNGVSVDNTNKKINLDINKLNTHLTPAGNDSIAFFNASAGVTHKAPISYVGGIEVFNARSLRSRSIETGAPNDGETLQWNEAASEWQYGAGSPWDSASGYIFSPSSEKLILNGDNNDAVGGSYALQIVDGFGAYISGNSLVGGTLFVGGRLTGNQSEFESTDFREATAVSTPASGKGRLQAKNDHNLYYKDSNGVETNLTGSSSIRFKENVSEITNAIDIVKQLRGVRFNWKKEYGGEKDVGVIAEELDKVLPELVKHESNGKAFGVEYARITSVLIEAVKEQQELIEKLLSEKND